MMREIILVFVQLTLVAQLTSSRKIVIESTTGNETSVPKNIIYQNPVEWAWDEYRKTTFLFVCIMLFSFGLNFFFYMRYLIDLAQNQWQPSRTPRVVRLQPTFEGEL